MSNFFSGSNVADRNFCIDMWQWWMEYAFICFLNTFWKFPFDLNLRFCKTFKIIFHFDDFLKNSTWVSKTWKNSIYRHDFFELVNQLQSIKIVGIYLPLFFYISLVFRWKHSIKCSSLKNGIKVHKKFHNYWNPTIYQFGIMHNPLNIEKSIAVIAFYWSMNLWLNIIWNIFIAFCLSAL